MEMEVPRLLSGLERVLYIPDYRGIGSPLHRITAMMQRAVLQSIKRTITADTSRTPCIDQRCLEPMLPSLSSEREAQEPMVAWLVRMHSTLRESERGIPPTYWMAGAEWTTVSPRLSGE